MIDWLTNLILQAGAWVSGLVLLQGRTRISR